MLFDIIELFENVIIYNSNIMNYVTSKTINIVWVVKKDFI
jgi:hypothetical protein